MGVRTAFARETGRKLAMELSDAAFPLDTWELCDRMGVRVYSDNEHLDPNEDAAVLCTPKGGLIIHVRKGKWRNSCRLRWTLAHEYGHIRLGHFQKYDLTGKNTAKLGTENAWIMNREANLFAEELLMPYGLVWVHADRGFEHMRRFFGVSRQSLMIRLKTLGIDFCPGVPKIAAAAETAAGYHPDDHHS